MHDRLVEVQLATHGLDAGTIQQARATRRFLIVVEGFDRSGVTTNVYVRYKLQAWLGKVVFTCRTSYLAQAPNPLIYFMPQTAHQRADAIGLAVVSFTTLYAETEEFGELIWTSTGALPILLLILIFSHSIFVYFIFFSSLYLYLLYISAQVQLYISTHAQQSITTATTSTTVRERWRRLIKEAIASRHMQRAVNLYSKRMREGMMIIFLLPSTLTPESIYIRIRVPHAPTRRGEAGDAEIPLSHCPFERYCECRSESLHQLCMASYWP